MKLSPRERAERAAAFRQMGAAEKLEYIAEYYRLPLVLGLAAAIVLGSVLFRCLTKKEILLYTAYINVAVGEEADALLSGGFADYLGEDPGKKEVYVYSGLYLSEDPAAENHEYSYASRLKLLASINAAQLDVALMNREAYDLLSASGYLLDLEAALAAYPEQYAMLSPYLQKNDVVLEDNAIEYRLNEAESYSALTRSEANALDLSGFSVPARAGFSGTVYLGVIANSPRLATAVDYAVYLLSE